MFSRSIHTVAKGETFFFFYGQVAIMSHSCLMSHSCFVHSSTDGHLGCFHILANVNNAAMNIRVLMFFWIRLLGSFGYIPRSGIAGSKGRSIFNFLRYVQKVFFQHSAVCSAVLVWDRLSESSASGREYWKVIWWHTHRQNWTLAHIPILRRPQGNGYMTVFHCKRNCVGLLHVGQFQCMSQHFKHKWLGRVF